MKTMLSWAAVGLSLLLLALASSFTEAATLTYDADLVTAGAQDGAGAGWNATSVNFWDGVADVLWPNTTADVAVFGAGSGAAGSVTVTTVTANGIIFNAPGSGNYTLAGSTITLGGTAPTITANVNATINSTLSAAGGYAKSGAAQLTVGANYTGGTVTIANGTLAFGNSISGDGFNPSTKQIVINSGGTVLYLGNNKVQNNVLYTINGGGTLNLNSQGDALGQVAGGGSILLGSSTMTIDGYSNPSTQTFAGVISGTGGVTLRSITGTQVLSGANTYSGQTQIQNGTLSAGSLNKVSGGSASSNLGAPTSVAAGTIALGSGGNTGRLLYTGGGESTDRVINLVGTTGGGILDQSGTGLLKFTSNFTATGAGSKTLTLQGSTAGAGEIAGAIVNNSAANTTAVTKAGTGTWTLSGNNSYTGLTTVAGGTLAIGGSASGDGCIQGDITINTGATLKQLQGHIIKNTSVITVNGTYNMNGASEALGYLAGNGQVQNLGAAEGIVLDLGSGTQTFVGKISGPGKLWVRGANAGTTGTQVLGGSNTYAGATIIDQGTLKLQAVPVAPVAGAMYWLKADAGVVQSGGSVSAWNDQTANGRNFTQGNSAQQPTYVANGINGLPAVLFDGANTPNNDRLVLGSATTPQSVFIVNQPKFDTNYKGLAGIWGTSGSDFGVRAASNTAWQSPGNSNDFSNVSGSTMYINGSVGSNFGSTTAAHFLEIIRGSAASMGSTAIGDYWGSSTYQRSYAGAIGEVIVYSTALSASDRELVEKYLLCKWFGIGATADILPTTTAVQIGANGTLDLNGVTQTIGSLSGAPGSSVLLGGGSLTTGDSTSTTFAGAVSGTGLVVKTGSGTWLVDGSISAPVQVQAGTLGGTGTLAGGVDVFANARLSPGASIGSLATGSLTLEGDSFFDVEVVPSDCDRVDVTGEVVLADAILALSISGDFASYGGTEYTLINNDGSGDLVTGHFAGLLEGSVINSLQGQFVLSYEGGDGNDVTLTAVPEPASALMVMLAVPAVAARVRRRLRTRS